MAQLRMQGVFWMEVLTSVHDMLELQNRTQHSVHRTAGTRRVFKLFSWLGVGSVKVAFSRPAHQRVTHTVGRFITIHEKVWEK